MSDGKLNIIHSEHDIGADVLRMIEQACKGVFQAINTGMTLFYWRIGKRAAAGLFSGRDGKLPAQAETPSTSADLELVTWLVIAEAT